jgi:predicted NBD/HSP70 family sugar kinase
VVAAAGWLAGLLDEPLFWSVVFLVLAICGWLVAIRHHRQLERLRGEPGTAPVYPVGAMAVSARGGRWLMGIDVGRTRLAVGVLEVRSPDLTRLPNSRDPRELVANDPQDPLKDRWRMNPRTIFDQLVSAILEVSANCPSLDGIGLGIPGQVDPVEGRVHHSPAAFERMGDVVNILASRLADRPEIARRLSLDASESGSNLRSAIAERILIDNDVRCATRAVLSEHVTDPGWENFACVFVGSGVGAGLVLDRQIYYGRGHSAGEVGHMTLDVEDRGVLCACGRHGVHWENLINGPGLEALAIRRDEASTRRLAEAHEEGSDTLSAPQIANLFEYLDGYSPQGIVPDTVASLLRESPELRGYVDGLIDEYARYVGVGVANMINILNLDHIVIGGGVIDGVYASTRFRNRVAEMISQHALEVPVATLKGGPRPEQGARPGWAWQGSALLFRDPSFQRALSHAG